MKYGGGIDYKKFNFGDKVVIKNKLERRRKETYKAGILKVWEQPPYETFEPTEGVFLGYRTLNDGRRRWFSDYIEYRPVYYFTAALVAINSKTNPFYSTDIEQIEG